MNRLLFLICGICWLGFGVGVGFFLLQSVASGANLQNGIPSELIFGSSGSALIGLVRVVGFLALSTFCFLIGIGLFSYGLASDRDSAQE